MDKKLTRHKENLSAGTSTLKQNVALGIVSTACVYPLAQEALVQSANGNMNGVIFCSALGAAAVASAAVNTYRAITGVDKIRGNTKPDNVGTKEI